MTALDTDRVVALLLLGSLLFLMAARRGFRGVTG